MQKIFFSLILLVIISCNGNKTNTENTGTTEPKTAKPQSISYSISNTYLHDTASFTQGLIVYKGKMYEGTGGEGTSKLMQTDFKTGKIIQSLNVGKEYFGEGITILNDTIYQLTWKSNKVFAYNLAGLKKVKEFPLNTEGWGITTNGKELIVSDGTSNLYYYNPGNFQLLNTQTVTEDGSLSYNLNELEFINGYVYANQWQAPYILKINPNSGAIVGKTDLTELWNKIKIKAPEADVPNGIAYDMDTKKIYITGKNWPELYEIQFSE